MFGAFSRSSKDRVIAVLDIGSGSIGGALVRLETGSLPAMLWTARKELNYLEQPTFDAFFSNAVEVLTDILTAMTASGVGQPDEIVCTFASPWYISETRHVSYQSQGPFVVSRRHLDRLISQESDSFVTYASNTFREYVSGDTSVMEVNVGQVKLNGYVTHNPFGKSARTLEGWIYFSVASQTVLERIEKALRAAYGSRPIRFASFGLVGFSVLRDMFPSVGTYLFVDMSGEMTDIAHIEDGILVRSVAFPFGKRHLLRQVSKALKSVPEDTLSRIVMSLRGEATPEEERKVRDHLSRATEVWQRGWSDSMREALGGSPAPHTVYVTCDDDIMPWFEQTLSDTVARTVTAIDILPAVQRLDTPFMRAYCAYNDPNMADPFITLESLYVRKTNDGGST